MFFNFCYIMAYLNNLILPIYKFKLLPNEINNIYRLIRHNSVKLINILFCYKLYKLNKLNTIINILDN